MLGVLGAVALLLLGAGWTKIRRPAPAAAAVARLGLLSVFGSPPLLRLVGLLESLIGLAVLGLGGRFAAGALALVFAGLTVIATRLVISAPGADCGCFGRPQEPISLWHVGVNVVATGVAVAGTLVPQPAVLVGVLTSGSIGVATIAMSVVLAGLAYLLMTALPELKALRRRLEVAR